MQLVKGAQSKLDQIVKEIQGCMVNEINAYLRKGELLHLINDSNYWQLSGAVTFREFCERELRMKSTACYDCIKVWKKFDKKLKEHPELSHVDQSRLVRMLPFVTDQNEDDLLHDAAMLDYNGFENSIRSLKGQTPTDDTLHSHDFDIISYKQCKVCGIKVKKDLDNIT